MTTYYKAVRKNRRSWRDNETLWTVGRIIRPSKVISEEDRDGSACGVGIHAGVTLLDAVFYQQGPSRYYEVEPAGEMLGRDESKVRFEAVRCVREIRGEALDKIAGFRLSEANSPVNPLLVRPSKLTEQDVLDLEKWASVWASVGASVWASVGDSVGASVWASVWASVGDSVWALVRASVRASVWASVWDLGVASVWDSVGASVRAYTGSLFRTEPSGQFPGAPLRALWLRGFVPSFDGATWRLHQGQQATVAYEWKP